MTVDVAVRMGFQGGKEAERAFGSMGKTGAASLTEIRAAAKDLPPHLVAVSRGVSAVKDGVEDMAARTGTLGSVARSFGPVGLAAAAVAGSIGLAAGAAVKMTRDAMVMADGIADAAETARVSTDTLQELRYMVQQSGGDFEDADEAIGAFQKKLGEAEAGMKKSLMWFEKLGFTQEQLKSFGSYDEALQAVSERIAGLGDEQQALAAANKVGLGAMYPLIRKGADEMARLRQEAHELGFVMSADVVKRLGDANDKFEATAHVVKTQFAEAFVNLAPVLLKSMQLIAGIARETNGVVDAMQRLENRTVTSMENRRGELLARMTKTMMAPVNLKPNGEMFSDAKRAYDKDKAEYDALGIQLALRRSSPDEAGPRLTGELADTDKDTGGAAKKARAEQARFDQALSQAKQNLIKEYQKAASRMIEEREADELDLIAEQRVQREREIDAEVADGDLTKAHAAELKLAEEKVRQGQIANLRMDTHQKLEDHRIAQERALVDLNDQLLQIAIATARTAAGRRRLELAALASRQAAENRANRVAWDNDPDLSPADRKSLEAGVAARQAADRAQVNRNTMGPMEAYRDSFIQTTDEMYEAIESLAVDGFETLNDEIVDAIMNAKGLGDMFDKVADQIVAGLLRITIQQQVIKPLSTLLGGGGGGGLLGALATGVGALLGGGSKIIAGSSGTGFGSDFTGYSVPRLSGRAWGGPAYGGDVRTWRERGVERFSPTSDGYVHDAQATARQIASAETRAMNAESGGGGPIAVNLNNQSGVPMRATARERPGQDGGRQLDIDLMGIVDSRADARVRDMLQGGRDDTTLAQSFGVKRRLSGS